MNANAGLEASDGVPPCLIWSCFFFEIPDIYWPILIQSVKSLMFPMCNLTTLQRRKTCFQMFHGESLSPIKAVPSLPVYFWSQTTLHLFECTPHLLQFQKRKNSPYWRLTRDFKVTINVVFMVLFGRATMPFTSVFPQLLFSPRVTQLNQLQWLVLWSVPSWDHAPSTVLGLLRLEQTTLVWLVAEPRCRDGSTCQSQAHHASFSLGAPWTQKKWRPCAA